MKHQLVVGQRLWFVPDSKWRKEEWVTITKIGRKWASLGYERIDLETLSMDGRGYSSPGKCYVDREAFELSRRVKTEYRTIQDFLQYQFAVPRDMTLERLKTIREALGMPEPDAEKEPT